MNLAVIIPAAGASSRYTASGGLRSKIDEDLGGRPVLQRTVELFHTLEQVSTIIVAGPAADYDDFILRHGDKLGLLGVHVCKGGTTHRWETVKAALQLVPSAATHIAVHDAARPITPPELIDRVLAAAEAHPAVIPAIPVPDTLKRVSAEEARSTEIDPLDAILGTGSRRALRRVEATVSRERLMLVQTPQVFDASLLRRAYAQADLSSTDDAGLVERLGEPVVVVEGDPRNLKITHSVDLHAVRVLGGFRPPADRPVHKRF
ncbi:MAG: 2-C-methyl-D-erythritol 4-phosphate cytidylyltransferase [Planctomycetota bacterium]|nr:2-C-methyl-D-erythritol 4-phosphate cytidylyltransferase [Planctomycetota bacterium]